MVALRGGALSSTGNSRHGLIFTRSIRTLVAWNRSTCRCTSWQGYCFSWKYLAPNRMVFPCCLSDLRYQRTSFTDSLLNDYVGPRRDITVTDDAVSRVQPSQDKKIQRQVRSFGAWIIQWKQYRILSASLWFPYTRSVWPYNGYYTPRGRPPSYFPNGEKYGCTRTEANGLKI